jgi:hypothetical protein
MAYRLGTLRFDDPEAGTITVEGDGFAAAGEPVTLLVSPEVQRYLAMSADEAAAAADIAKGYREALKQIYAGGDWKPTHIDPAARPARQEVEARIEQLLGRDRAERLKRLSWRIRGGDALLDDDVAAALQLTPDQRRALAAAAAENERDHQRILGELRSVRLQSPTELQDRGTRAHDAGQERLLALLTTEQRQKFEQLRGGGR